MTNNTFYTGMTSNLEKRLKEHNTGKSTYTRKFMPWELVHFEFCESREEARIREKYLKTSEGKMAVLKKQ